MSFDLKLQNGDIPIKNGSLVLVRDQEKLVQDILKLLFTETGELKAHPWYGTPMLSKAIGSAFDYELLQREVVSAIQYGLNNLKVLQDLQERDNQYVSPREKLSKIGLVEVIFDPNDKRKMIVKIEVATRSNELITESFVVNI